MHGLAATSDTGGVGIPTSGRPPVPSGAQLRVERIRSTSLVYFRTIAAPQLA